MKNITRFKFEILFSVLGAIAGYAYWHYVGCASGSCAITARWYTSTLYGVVIGFLGGQIISDAIQKKKKSQISE
jgi:hypothetical protein